MVPDPPRNFVTLISRYCSSKTCSHCAAVHEVAAVCAAHRMCGSSGCATLALLPAHRWERRGRRIALDIALGLRELHGIGVIHRWPTLSCGNPAPTTLVRHRRSACRGVAVLASRSLCRAQQSPDSNDDLHGAAETCGAATSCSRRTGRPRSATSGWRPSRRACQALRAARPHFPIPHRNCSWAPAAPRRWDETGLQAGSDALRLVMRSALRLIMRLCDRSRLGTRRARAVNAEGSCRWLILRSGQVARLQPNVASPLAWCDTWCVCRWTSSASASCCGSWPPTRCPSVVSCETSWWVTLLHWPHLGTNDPSAALPLTQEVGCNSRQHSRHGMAVRACCFADRAMNGLVSVTGAPPRADMHVICML